MVKSISPLVIKFLRLIGFFFKCFGPRLLRFLRLIKGIVLLPVNLRSLFDRKRIVAEPPPLSIYFKIFQIFFHLTIFLFLLALFFEFQEVVPLTRSNLPLAFSILKIITPIFIIKKTYLFWCQCFLF